MTTANHPQNEQPQGGATDLGQISKKASALEIIKDLLRAKKALRNAKPGTPAHAWANELNRAAWTAARQLIAESKQEEKP